MNTPPRPDSNSKQGVSSNTESVGSSAAIDCYNRGVYLQQHGQPDQAVQAYRQALQHDPRLVPAMNNLGNLLKDLGRCQEAIDQFKRALKRDPQHPMLLNNLGQTFANCGNDTLAVIYLRKAVRADHRYAEAFVNLGNLLRHDDESQAVAAYRKALAINPQLAEAHNNLGALLEEQGHFDQAREALREALRLKPNFGEAHRHLANLESHAELTEHLRTMEALIADATIGDQDKIHIGFGLGKAYEEIGDYTRAMELIRQANQLKRRSFSYSPETDRDFFQFLKSSFDAARLSGEASEIADETPIFIVGMPRSGTSLVEQILASHPDVFGGGERLYLPQMLAARCADLGEQDLTRCLDRLTRVGFRRIGRDYLARLRAHARKARYITDKLPHNFLRIGLIRLALPKARIIHVVRDPIDTCLSIYKNYFIAHHAYAYDQQELGDYYRLYTELMAHWQAVAGNAIYNIQYEHLVADPEAQIRALLSYCGLDWSQACLDFHTNKRRVATASSAQVRRPIYTDSVALWRRYESGLGELLRVLDPPSDGVKHGH